MPYKPKFCCQCGERIERIGWKPWTSRRFCELCETEFGIHDKVFLLVAAGGVLMGMFGIGSYLQTPSAPIAQPAQFISRNTSKTETNQPNLMAANANIRSEKPDNKTPQIAPVQKLTTRQSENASNSAQEVSYFCGAATKKGTPCSRRVKGGGRCWQHEGQPAILPQEKLLVSNN